MAVGTRMQQRRANEADWATSAYILAPGEIGVTLDTGIVKIGNGTSPWSELDPAFSSQYLPILGTAANSALLGGVSAASFVKVADTATAATGDKVAMRLSDGRLKATTGTATDDVVNLAQQTAALTSQISRTVTADFTLALTDITKMIFVNNSAYTPSFVCTIPTNASVAFPIGSVVDIVTTGKGPTTLTPAGGVTLNGGITVIYGGGTTCRLVKTATDTWRVVNVCFSPPPLLKRIAKDQFALTLNTFTKVRLDGTDRPTFPFANNSDTLGAGEQYASGTDLYRCYCRRSGWYATKAQISLYPNGTGRATVELKVNGVDTYLGAGMVRGGYYDQTPNMSALIPLNVGDYVEVWCYTESASSVVNDANYCSSFFEWCWRRPL